MGTLLEAGVHLERAVAEAGQVRYAVGSESRGRALVDCTHTVGSRDVVRRENIINIYNPLRR